MTAGAILRRPLAAAALTLSVAACGSDDAFTAEEFIGEANQHGAGLVLGSRLESGREETTIYEVAFAETGDPANAGHDHGGGSLTVLEDGDAGLAEYERCESAVSLVCFRAANIALFFEGDVAPAEIARLEEALRAMAS